MTRAQRPSLVSALVALACGQGPRDESGARADAADAYGTPLVCTSGEYWTGENSGAVRMRPGHPCIACHETSPGAPKFAVAGTVYPTAHEPDDCYGIGGAVIQVTDALSRVFEVTVGSSGNFFLFASDPPVLPLRARVIFDGRTRDMKGARDTGDCNRCHTTAGSNDAPGRIPLP